MAAQLAALLPSTLSLLDQFQETLTPSSSSAAAAAAPTESTSPNQDAKPLALLSASSAALRAQVTKLSLLAITTPFTASAINTVLRAVNDSVLPSLITAALLITPGQYTRAFHLEILLLARTSLAEFGALVRIVKGIAEEGDDSNGQRSKKNQNGGGGGDMSKAQKDVVTVAAGRVWEACDSLTGVANRGVVGFVVSRVEQWRDLIRDAVEEIEEWDPEEDGDDFFDDLLGGEKGGDDEDEENDDEDDDDDQDTAALQERKKSTLRFLKPVAQVYPAIINNRLKNAGEAPLAAKAGVAKLESLMSSLGQIPDQVDEAAGALYEDDADRSVEFLKKIRTNATEAVSSLELPWNAVTDVSSEQKVEDKFTVWSRTWLKVMGEVGKSIETVTE